MKYLEVDTLISSELKVKQREELQKYINKHQTGKNKFLVLDNEAGFGKSLQTNTALAFSDDKVLLVKKYISEANEAEVDILGNVNFINKIYDEYENSLTKKVIVINAQNSFRYENENRQEMLDADVLIISHKKYQILANDDNKRKIYSNGRQTLIIDEFLEPDIVTISADYFENNKYLFTWGIGETEYNKVRNCYLEIIEGLKGKNGQQVGNLRVVSDLSELKEELRVNLLDELNQSINELKQIYEYNKVSLVNRQLPNIKEGSITYHNYQVFFTELELFFNQQFIYDNFYQQKRIATNLLYDYWTLENNIILDASARILHSYKLRPDIFELKHQERIFDYSNTTCHVYRENISKTKIKNNYGNTASQSIQNYFNSIIDHIESNNRVYSEEESDHTLIIVDSQFENTVKSLLSKRKVKGIVEVEHHGNVFGKNTWRDFNKVYITSIFNATDYLYILHYAFFSGKEITTSDLKTRIDKGNKKFQNKKITSVQYSWRVHHLYQELKRINRNLNKKSDFYLISADDWIIESIPLQFNNIQMEYDFDIQLGGVKKSRQKRALTHAQIQEYKRFIDILKDMHVNNQTNKEYFLKMGQIENGRLKQVFYRAKDNYPTLINNQWYEIDLEKTFENRNVKQIIFTHR